MSLLGKITGFDQARGYITLLAVAAAAAGLYAWGAIGHAEAGKLERQAELLCSAAGSQFVAAPAKPGAKPKKGDRGKACLAEIRELAAFKRDTTDATNGVLAGAVAEQAAKARKDAARAAQDTAATRAAVERMEIENAAVEGDRVSGAWFGALNDLAGLRDPAD